MPGVLAALGPEAVAENVLGVLPANFDEFAVVPLAFYDAGVGVVEGRAIDTTKAGGKLDAPVAWVWTVRDSRPCATSTTTTPPPGGRHSAADGA